MIQHSKPQLRCKTCRSFRSRNSHLPCKRCENQNLPFGGRPCKSPTLTGTAFWYDKPKKPAKKICSGCKHEIKNGRTTRYCWDMSCICRCWQYEKEEPAKEPSCVCGNPTVFNTVHRRHLPCYIPTERPTHKNATIECKAMEIYDIWFENARKVKPYETYTDWKIRGEKYGFFKFENRELAKTIKYMYLIIQQKKTIPSDIIDIIEQFIQNNQ